MNSTIAAARLAHLIHNAARDAIDSDLRQNYHWSPDTPQRLASLTSIMLEAVDDTDNSAQEFYFRIRQDITNLFDALLQDSELTRESAPHLFRLSDALWDHSDLDINLLDALGHFAPVPDAA